MSEHTARVRWRRGDAPFTDRRYSRAHEWAFDGGAVVAAAASPLVVRPAYTDPAGVDPEEAFVAALSSCHMLFFLSFAAERGFVVDAYDDDARGLLAPGADGRVAFASVTLRPAVRFAATAAPSPAEHVALHHAAHEACYLANSVRCPVHCEPTLVA